MYILQSLQPGDKILEVNGTSFAHMTHAEAVQLMRNAWNVIMMVQSPSSARNGTICYFYLTYILWLMRLLNLIMIFQLPSSAQNGTIYSFHSLYFLAFCPYITYIVTVKPIRNALNVIMMVPSANTRHKTICSFYCLKFIAFGQILKIHRDCKTDEERMERYHDGLITVQREKQYDMFFL